jgi:hypothetical protein
MNGSGRRTDSYPDDYLDRYPVKRVSRKPALLHVPPTVGTTIRFQVVTPDHHPIAVTAEPALAAASALAVARHHRAHYAAIAASDGRWLEVHLDGHTCLAPPTSDATGWPTLVEQAVERLATTGP